MHTCTRMLIIPSRHHVSVWRVVLGYALVLGWAICVFMHVPGCPCLLAAVSSACSCCLAAAELLPCCCLATAWLPPTCCGLPFFYFFPLQLSYHKPPCGSTICSLLQSTLLGFLFVWSTSFFRNCFLVRPCGL